MHTLKVIAAGFALLGALHFLSRRLKLGGGDPTGFAVKLFLPLWLVASLVNLWVGVSRAGYTVLQEMPFFSLVFGLPAAFAILLFLRFR
ncbi:hypothetical protein ASE63_16985 [Bosea sp. Root381]|jgi:hypothetical protein|uniref:hypothetical protein n=1 Tax=Bosea sp. Root381 TaxID=1736524 RepID=UPI000701026F|nr:hypothetical protein [Bosea sp. Root381]KRE15906.1 hypothetical protein ASE63_16985 [Bosea sp. Root381]